MKVPASARGSFGYKRRSRQKSDELKIWPQSFHFLVYEFTCGEEIEDFSPNMGVVQKQRRKQICLTWSQGFSKEHWCFFQQRKYIVGCVSYDVDRKIRLGAGADLRAAHSLDLASHRRFYWFSHGVPLRRESTQTSISHSHATCRPMTYFLFSRKKN